MIRRREFLHLAGGALLSLAMPGCAASPPLRKDVLPDFGGPDRPWLGLATSLREEHVYEAVLEGRLPDTLRGTLYRNGPGLFDRGGLRKRTLLDGDGMVQAFRFHRQGVQYRNRFVRTRKFVEESAAGAFIYPTWSTQAPGGLLANFWSGGRLLSQAGVSVYIWRGRLYAFDESNLPFELDPITLETVGQSRLGLADGFTIYSAHPKLDPQSSEWLHFGLRYGPNPAIHFTVFSADGGLKLHRAIPMPRYVYLHDWFVSERHLVVSLQPVEIKFWGFLLGLRSIADSLRWQPEKGNLLMVLPRDGSGEPIFIPTEARYMWHSVNAFEVSGEIAADFVGYDNPDHFVGPDPVISAVMAGRTGNFAFPGELRRYRIDPAKRTAREERLDKGSYEWPRINEQHRCSRYRFAYLCRTRPGEFFWSYLVRVDMESGRTTSCDFGEGNYCSEPVFVPKPGFHYAPHASEEPGWVSSLVYDSHTRKSFLAILDAEHMVDGPLAKVHLSHHAPFSYHGWWQPAA